MNFFGSFLGIVYPLNGNTVKWAGLRLKNGEAVDSLDGREVQHLIERIVVLLPMINYTKGQKSAEKLRQSRKFSSPTHILSGKQ